MMLRTHRHLGDYLRLSQLLKLVALIQLLLIEGVAEALLAIELAALIEQTHLPYTS